MSKIVRRGQPLHECDIPAPNTLTLSSVVECDCGRRWKLRRMAVTFKGWSRTIPTLVRDLLTRQRVVCRWADVRRWNEPKPKKPSPVVSDV